MNNHFIRPFVPSQTHVIKEASEVNAMLLKRGIVTTIYCNGERDYSEGVGAVWTTDIRNLWIIEHDIIPSDGVLDEMELCNYPMCVPLYHTNPAHSGLQHPVIPHRFFDSNHHLTWISAGMQFADKVGIGCIKFHKMARDQVKFGSSLWHIMDTLISEVFIRETGMQFHVHNTWVQHKQDDDK